MHDSFSKWLRSDHCIDTLRICAKKVISTSESKGIILDDAYMSGENYRDYTNAVSSNIWEFLKEKSEDLTRKAYTFLVTDDLSGIIRFICQEFIDFCIDKRRNDTPFHAYYRHMRNVLSQADGINYQAISRKGSYYAWSQSADLPYFDSELNCKEMEGCSIGFSEINKKPAMIKISKHYWNESLKILLDEYLLSIRGLVAFVAVKYPLTPQFESDPCIEDEDTSESQRPLGSTLINQSADYPDGAWERQLSKLSKSIVEIDLEQIAKDCAAQLSPMEKSVICGLDEGLTLADIAKRLGIKGPSNVSYHRKLAEKKLRTAWSLWGQPDSEHYAVAEEEQRIFFKKTIQFCKNSDACRDSHKEGIQ